MTQISAEQLHTGVLTAYNKKATVDLTVVKIDKNNREKLLSGAEFTIRELDPYQKGAITLPGGKEGSAETGDNGTVLFTDLEPGHYYEIKETKVPDDYILQGNETLYVKVTEDGVMSLAMKSDKKPSEWKERSNDRVIILDEGTATIGNTPGVALPSTGGPGTALYTLGGMALLAMAALMGYCESKRRRLEKR